MLERACRGPIGGIPCPATGAPRAQGRAALCLSSLPMGWERGPGSEGEAAQVIEFGNGPAPVQATDRAGRFDPVWSSEPVWQEEITCFSLVWLLHSLMGHLEPHLPSTSSSAQIEGIVTTACCSHRSRDSSLRGPRRPPPCNPAPDRTRPFTRPPSCDCESPSDLPGQ
ncbi:hypothetical protein GQ53DRAFT_187050 [Thozetella sp. PMI_491]|nr:hypothetical protein GQ53DRAFT_187050 [Thozetella sp. PMI_491]